MAKVAPICSSSKGNCTYIGGSAGLLVDAGCSFKALRCGLELCGLSMDNVKAVVVTHEHIDHVRGLLQLTKHTKIPIYASEGTLNYLVSHSLVDTAAMLYPVSELKDAPLDMELGCFNTPHDAAESLGYTVHTNEYKLAFCTDLGEVTPEVRANVKGCGFVFLESNYEPSMLSSNPNYPYVLKKRIASDHGHLSNPDCGKFITELVRSGATRFVLGHLSPENNTPTIAYNSAVAWLEREGMLINRDCTVDIAPVTTSGKYVVI